MKWAILPIYGFFVVVTGLSVPSAWAAATTPKGVPPGVEEARVWGYVDGDSFKARIDDTTEIVTLIGVDAPDPKEDACYSSESATHLRELLPKKATIYLERDRDEQDSQGRLPRFVWIARDGDPKAFLVNTKQVRDGYAELGTAAPTGRYADNLAKADQQAQAANRGLWGACYAPNGDWVGTTANGDAISFTVTNHGISKLAVSLTCATGGGGYATFRGTTTWKVPQPMSHDNFSVQSGGGGTLIKLAGSFISPTDAQGTLEISTSGGMCGDVLTMGWSATRQ